MMLNRAIVLGVLVVTGTTWAESKPAPQQPTQPDATQIGGGVVDAGLAPRSPVGKIPNANLRMPQEGTGRLIVKFNDNVKARVNADAIVSTAAVNVTNAQRVIMQYGLTVSPAIRMDTTALGAIEGRAAGNSGKAQPDLAGMMYLSAPEGVAGALLEAAARDLNGLPEVEFVQFEPKYVIPYVGGVGACCIDTVTCQDTDSIGCTLLGGQFMGPGTTCATPGICSTITELGRCCIPAFGITTCVDGLNLQQCSAQFGVFGGEGSTCDGLPGGACPTLGACCLTTGCQTLLQSQCVSGLWLEGINCAAPGICQPVGKIGRCCIPASTSPPTMNCLDGVDEEFCTEQGGVYGGDGTACIDINDLCPMVGACCIDNDCIPVSLDDCALVPDSTYLGDGSNCTTDGACDEPDCGVPGTHPCNECHDPNDPFSAGLFCDNEDCCEAVCAVDPFCCEEDADVTPPGRLGPPHWDSICVALAGLVCTPPQYPPDPSCPSAGSCLSTHGTFGCENRTCCVAVCNIEPFCCSDEWDAVCVNLASTTCQLNSPSSQVTPQFSDAQGYLTKPSYFGQFGGLPENAIIRGIFEPPFPPSPQLDPCALNSFNIPTGGWFGQGMDLNGLWQFGNALVAQQGPGAVNRARGKGIKVGVIEHSAFADWQNPAWTHEDLRGKVIPEAGQTIFINPLNTASVQSGNHGTACLGIIGAKDDGVKGHSFNALGWRNLLTGELHVSDEIGTVGIAPDADLYFFPSTSLEEGGRLLTAISKALSVFGPGDILSFSIGPTTVCSATQTTMVSNPAEWVMVRLASDLGVTCFVAAGNACCNVDTSAQFGPDDCGAIIVGAVSPGYPYCRADFSNFCQTCANFDSVDCSAWGYGVATLGYGELYLGNDPANASGRFVRSYTNAFNGTSAATPQMAALGACIQGLCKQVFDIPLTPAQLRTLLRFNGFNQCDILNVPDIPGPIPDNPCLGDFDPEQDAARIGGPANFGAYPILISEPGYVNNIADAIVNSPMGPAGGGSVVSMCILRGTYQSGAAASLNAPDDNSLKIRSQYTTRANRPSAANCPQFAGQIAGGMYLGTGEVIDVLVEAKNTVSGANAIRVETKVGYPGATSIEVVECYDWLAGRWSQVGVGVMDSTFANVCANNGAGLDFCFQFDAGSAGRFIQGGSNRILCRVYIVGLFGALPGGLNGDGGSSTFNGRIDWIDVTTSAGGGFNPNGVGGGTSGGSSLK